MHWEHQVLEKQRLGKGGRKGEAQVCAENRQTLPGPYVPHLASAPTGGTFLLAQKDPERPQT